MGEIIPTFNAIVDKIKAAKDLREGIDATKQGFQYLVLGAQQFSQQMEGAGVNAMFGVEKKALVVRAAQATFTPILNKLINIPILNEDQEASLIDKGTEFFVSRSIDKAVVILKANGWTIK